MEAHKKTKVFNGHRKIELPCTVAHIENVIRTLSEHYGCYDNAHAFLENGHLVIRYNPHEVA